MKRYQAFSDFYDAEYEHLPNLQKDIPFFLRQLPKRKSLRVLDVCCGSGRSCIPMAQAGHRVVGIDIDKDMLALAKRKRDAVGISPQQLELIHQDAMKLRVAGKFGGRFDWATIFFNTFLNFTTLDAQDRVLLGMRNLLKPGGKIWLDLFQPDLDRLARNDEKGIDASLFFVPAIDKTVQRTIDIRRDRCNQTMHVTFNYTWFDSHGAAKKRRRDFDMTYIFPRELHLLLERSGYVVEKIFGDYDGAPLTSNSSRMIAVARKI